MVNKIIKLLTGKELIIYNRHRQTIPIVNNKKNKQRFIFLNALYLWRMVPLPGTIKLKYKIIYFLFNIFSPKYILDINWVGKWQSLYKVWTKNHPKSKFIVVQHGSYVGGIVTDKAHRYTKCDVFLTWGDYFTEMFRSYNKKKEVNIISFGNTVYNDINRMNFKYYNNNKDKILLAPSVLEGYRLQEFYKLTQKLKELGFKIFIKEHNLQRKFSDIIIGTQKIKGNIFRILQSREFDIIISDHSSCLIDAIYFKNKVIYFSPEGEINEYVNNIYSKYLINLYTYYSQLKSKDDLFNFINIEAQEKLFKNMVYIGNNILPSL